MLALYEHQIAVSFQTQMGTDLIGLSNLSSCIELNPPSGQLPTAGMYLSNGELSTHESPHTLDEAKEAAARLRGKAAGICNIIAELLKAGGEVLRFLQS